MTDPAAAADTVRRVVTAQQGGAGVIFSDAPIPPVDLGGGAKVFEVWRASHPSCEEPAGTDWALVPPVGGSVFRIAEFPPAGTDEAAFMHCTSTIDFGVVLEGELTLVMNDQETVLRPGDTFVQRQANHGWINRGANRVRMAVVLIDGPQ